MTNVGELLSQAAASLTGRSASPQLDALVLLEFYSGFDRSSLRLNPDQQVSSSVAAVFQRAVDRRAAQEPVAYITGTKEFWSLDFNVSPAVLIPRPETELLVELGRDFLKTLGTDRRVLDLGTGSGCIAISLAHQSKLDQISCQLMASDLSAEALALASQNAERLGVKDLMQFVQGSWYQALHGTDLKFDLIVSNPPYIAVGDSRVSAELVFEPQSALYSGSDGLDAVREVIGGLESFLKPGGMGLIEIGSDQGKAVFEIAREILPRAKIVVVQDLAGKDRVIKIERNAA